MKIGKTTPFYQKYRNFILYALIGILSTGLEFAVYFLLCRFMPYLVANVIGFLGGVLCSYLLNRNINFKVLDKAMSRFLLFLTVQLICLALSTIILYLLVDLAKIDKMIAKGITLIPIAVLPYFLNKKITFGNLDRKKPKT